MSNIKASAQITIHYIIDIKAIHRYYLLQGSTLAKPSKPTTYPPASTWTTTEPTYTSGSNNSLYFVDCTVFNDNAFTYSDVSLSSSYEAAKAAYNKAVSADSRVADAETQIEQNTSAIALRATKTDLNSLMEGNLVVNGFGLNRDNYNFNQWVYDGADKCDGFPSFKFTGIPKELYIPYYMIPIDISKTYEFSMRLKGDATKKMYLGWDEFDIDGKQISPTYCMGYSASTTTLAKELKNGDTVVYLTSTSGWTSTSATHQLGLIFWNYKDSTGYQYPVGVYSRNAWTNLYTYSNVNKTNNTITLNSAWNHGTFSVGTKVSQSNSSGHKYFNYTNAAPPAAWTETKYTISGNQELYMFTSNKFSQAAKYARFIILHNYSGGTTSSTTKISKVSLVDITLKKNLTDNYYTKTQTDAKIKVESDKITSAVSRISTNETAISTLEQTAEGLTAKLNTTNSNVTTAQSTANTAKTNAATAQSTANTAKTNAATAQTTANTARTEAANAAKVATNYLNFSTNGLVVGDMTSSSLGKNVLIDSDSVDIRSGTTTLASFGANKVILGQNAANSEIDLCNGAGVIKAITSGASTSYPHYDSIAIGSQEIEFNAQRFVANITNVGGSTTPAYQNTAEIYTLSYASSAGSYARIGSECKITSSGDLVHAGFSTVAVETVNSSRAFIYAESWDESANTWNNSNQVSVYPTQTVFSKQIKLGGVIHTGKNSILWSGGYYMSGSQTATLSAAVSAQPHGVVLLWSYYVDGANDNSNFIPFFVPKQFVSSHNGKGISMFMTNGTMSVAASKYVYVSDTKLTGHTNNDDAATAKGCGITSTPKQWVLRYVIGV